MDCREIISRGILANDLELGIRELHPARSPVLDLAIQNDVRMRFDHVFEECLVRPHGGDLTTLVLHERAEQAKASPASCLQARVEHFSRNRRHLSGFERCDGLQATAIFVT
jgi:hypothetical protein